MNPSFGQHANYSGGVFILPDVVPSLSLNDKVHFLADPEFIPEATRVWTCDSGTITAGGLYESNKASGRSKVSCQLRHNNVTYPAVGQATLNHHHDFQFGQGAVQSGTIDLPDFPPPSPSEPICLAMALNNWPSRFRSKWMERKKSLKMNGKHSLYLTTIVTRPSLLSSTQRHAPY